MVLPAAQYNMYVESSSNRGFLPSADYKVVCRRPWNHFLTFFFTCRLLNTKCGKF
jgi:hypothetical protein